MVCQRRNHLDVFLVSLSILVMWILEPAKIEFANMLRKLTVLRVMRLMRLAYKVRMRPEFKEMWALLKGLTESGETLFWTYVMIGCVLYFFAIVATSLIGKMEGFKDGGAAQASAECFSDVMTSMVTL